MAAQPGLRANHLPDGYNPTYTRAAQPSLSATYVPDDYDVNYYEPAAAPELISPEPQRHMPEMSDQIQHGLQNMALDYRASTATLATEYQQEISNEYKEFSSPDHHEVPNLSPFPKLVNPPSNVPPSDEDFESTLWNARTLVLASNDPEMQLAWAADALIYVGVCADNEERIVAAKPSAARSSTPNIEHTLKEDAMNIVTFLSSQHHPKAEFLRGMWLEWGRYGQREDKKEAFRCYSRAADKGYARAEYRIGMLYESSNDAPKALRHYHRGVDAGDSASCYRLGMMTLRGQHGQQQDWPRAVSLIKESADTADENAAQGAYVYGMLLARQLPQITVPENYLPADQAKARVYIEKAAFLRFAKAQLKMGSAYELGDMGCEFDPALSMHYYALASKQGEPEADMALSKWFLVGQERVFAKNEELAYYYAERAASTGLATAEFALGYFNEIGMCVSVNIDKSLEWYNKASQHGSADAKGRISALASRQVLSKKDHEQVAIQRIKSMHNSVRGARPVRTPQPPMPPLPQNAAHGNGNGIRSPVSPSFPPRATSAVPYPLDDRPPVVHTNQPRAPLPYPADSSPTSAYPTDAGGAPWQQPPQRPATTSYTEQRPPYQNQRPAYAGPPQSYGQQGPPPSAQYDRRYAPMPNPNQGQRPPMNQPPQRRPMPDQRMASPAQHQQGFQPMSPGHPPYHGPSPGQSPYQGSGPIPPRSAPPQQAGPPPPQRVDIGYSAPYQDRRYQGSQGPMPPQQQGRPPQGRPPQTGPPPNFNPTQGRPLPPQQQGGRPPQPQQVMRPPPKDHIPQQGPPAAAKPAPPRGPKTFDEMGVPTKKNDTCSMM